MQSKHKGIKIHHRDVSLRGNQGRGKERERKCKVFHQVKPSFKRFFFRQPYLLIVKENFLFLANEVPWESFLGISFFSSIQSQTSSRLQGLYKSNVVVLHK